MKKFHFSLLLILFSFQLMAQAPASTAAGYYFATGTNYGLVNISDGIQVIGPGYELVSTITFDMGFNFNFAGTVYNRFSVSSSGTFGLGTTPVSPIYYEPRNSILAPYYIFPLFSPWSDELTTADNGGVSYKIVTVNNLKKLVIEWRVRASSDYGTTNYNKTFQAWLIEGSNRIQYVYGNSPVRDENSYVGFAKSNPDYKLVNSTYHTTGTYSNNVWPGAGRSYIFSPVEIIGNPLPITLDEGGATVNVNCFGAANGAITLGAISGGDGNYTINWTGPNSFTATGAAISNLGAGTYFFTITDGSGAEPLDGSITVNEPAVLDATVTAVASCAGNYNGSITISNPQGGSGNYEFMINNEDWQSSGSFNTLGAGIYTLQMRDASHTGCIKNLGTQTVTEFALSATLGSVEACAGTSNGSISISNATGGSGNYEYNINNGNWQSSNTFSGLNAGTYHVQMRDIDFNSCIKILGDQTVNEYVLNASVYSAATCTGVNNGSIAISQATGGSGNYAYQLNNGSWQTEANFTGLAAGSYNLNMRDAGNTGCIKNLGNIIITQSEAPAVSIVANTPAFCNKVILTANAANAATYTWSNSQTGMSINLNNNSADGQYKVTVINTNGCSGSAVYQYVKQNLLNNYTLVGIKSVSLGENNTVNGAVGLTTAGQTTSIKKNSVINGYVKSPVITLQQPVTITQGIINAAAVLNLPPMLLNTAVTTGLPNLTLPDDYSGPAINYNVNNLTIGKRAQVTITGNVFGKIIIREAADVIFTAADISVNDIDAENGKALSTGIDYLSLSFNPNTIIRVKNTIQLGDRNLVNGFGSTFYMADLNTDNEEISIKGKNTIVNANMYMLQGTLEVRGSDASAPCTMNGTYIAETIFSDKYVNWSAFDCNVEAVQQLTQTQPEQRDMTREEIFFKLEQKTTVEESNAAKPGIAVYPSPTTGKFIVQLNNNYSRADISIVNQLGFEMRRESFTNMTKGNTLKFDISQYTSGIYYIKISTPGGVYTRQVVKIK